ncbi:MAG: transposase, partial [Treponema sp.]|nr:transposase [Treponema sp.]
MAGGESFDMAEEFAGVNFNEERLEKRLRKTMETLARDPQRSMDLFGTRQAAEQVSQLRNP